MLLAAPPAFAVEPGEQLADPVLEARARSISTELRCLVCQNQSIDDSNAPLARDLRLLVRERLSAGDTDAAVRKFVVDRYGTFVLLRPPLSLGTLLLWAAPLLVLLAVLRMASGVFRRATLPGSGSPGEARSLTAAERTRLDELLKSDDTERRHR
jgi:cytochrome c-type biogenesis protein CcmH